LFVIPQKEEHHIFPDGEFALHKESMYCECDPQPGIDDDGKFVWIHVPLDNSDLLDGFGDMTGRQRPLYDGDNGEDEDGEDKP
jgi:hypothetical protein